MTLAIADLETGVNKFYIIQLLEKQGGGYALWTKWGRTQSGLTRDLSIAGPGGPGPKGYLSTLREYDDLKDAINDFEKSFKAKVGR